MAGQRVFAQSINQSDGTYVGGGVIKKYSKFSGLDNIKSYSTDDYASCHVAPQGGDYDRPSTVELTEFFNNNNVSEHIPSGAVINKITVRYSYRKYGDIDGYYPDIPVRFTLLGCNGETAESNVGFSSGQNVLNFVPTGELTAEDINSPGFGVQVDFRTNAGQYAGDLFFVYCFVDIDYTPIEYALGVSNISTAKEIDYDFGMDLRITNITQISRNTECIVVMDLPDGVVPTSGQGAISYDSDLEKWIITVKFINNWTQTVRVKLNSSLSGGNKTITFTEKSTNVSVSATVDLGGSDERISVNFEENIFNVGVVHYIQYVDEMFGNYTTPRTVTIKLPASCTVNGASADHGNVTWETSGNNTIITWQIPANTHKDYLLTSIVFNNAGIFESVVYDTGMNWLKTNEIKVVPSNYTRPFYTKHILNDDVFDLMEPGYTYTIISYMKLVARPGETNYEYDDNYLNHRFHVFHDSEPADIDVESAKIREALHSDIVPFDGKWHLVQITFYYDGVHPVEIYWTGEFVEKNVTKIDVLFTSPIVMEYAWHYQNGLENYGLWPLPLKNLITADNWGTVNLPAFTQTNLFRVFDFSIGNVQNINRFALQGFQVMFDYLSSSDFSVSCSLVAPNNLKGMRTISLPEGNGTAIIGDVFDLFGLKYTDFDNLTALQAELSLYNPFQNESIIQLTNMRFGIMYSFLESDDWVKFWINGEQNDYYNIYLNKITVYGGPEREVNIFNVESTDIHKAYRQNIVPKEIELEFEIYACNVRNSSLLFQRAARYFANKRDKYNKPIPNQFEIELYPGYVFDYVMEEPLEEDIQEGGTFECKVKLLIPDGTMRKKKPTVANTIGTNGGIAKAIPKIQVMASSHEINITEKTTGQTFIMADARISPGDILIIDSNTRRVNLLKKNDDGNYIESDITNGVDYDSDWIVLHPMTDFTIDGGSSCIVQHVEFTERW